MTHTSKLMPSWLRTGPASYANQQMIVAAVVLSLFLSNRSNAQFGPTQVRVAPVVEKEISGAATLVGSVRPYTRSIVASEVAGLVNKMAVQEGDPIKAGDVICTLRDTTARFLYEQAEAQVKQLGAQLAELEAGSRPEEIEQARAAQQEAEAIVEKWTTEYERLSGLRKEGVASLKEYNDTLAEYTAVKQRLIQATAARRLAEEGPRQEEIDQARFAVIAAQAEAQRLKHELDLTTIKAPFDGFVIAKETELGQWIIPGGSVVEMIDLSRVLIRVDVPESIVSGLKRGQEIVVMVDALNFTEFTGKIKHIIPQADEKARTFPVEIEIANEKHAIKAGMFARARVPTGDNQKRLVVPVDAVLQRGGMHFVVAVGPSPTGEPGTFGMPIPVVLGATQGDEIAVSSPMVQPGMQVAIKGHDRVYTPGPVVIWGQPSGQADGKEQPATRPAE